MERVYVVHPTLNKVQGSTPSVSAAEVIFVKNVDELNKASQPTERIIALANKQIINELENILGRRLLALHMLPENMDFIPWSIENVLKEARLQHDLEAAEAVAWSGMKGDEGYTVEFLGRTILDIATCWNFSTIEEVLYEACKKLHPIQELCLYVEPPIAPIKILGKFQLAVPVLFQKKLRAHIYVRFAKNTNSEDSEKITDALLGLTDAVGLAIERIQMIQKAEQTKILWEASFDAVEDPLLILNQNYEILRTNLAFKNIFSSINPFTQQELEHRLQSQQTEWEWIHDKKHWTVFLDAVTEQSHNMAHLVIRLHDSTQEFSLREKILAREQNVELGILVGSIAHEINNPIGGILAIGQLLLKDIVNDSLRNDIHAIVQAAERCKNIVQTMLSLVRKAEDTEQDFDLIPCLESARDLMGPELKRLGVSCSVNKFPKQGAAIIHGNKNKIMQAFFHLIQASLNAIADSKKMEQKDLYFLRIHVDLSSGCIVRIIDNGSDSTHEYEKNSSVAYTIAKMLIEAHGGSIEYFAQNENIFKITFPSTGSLNIL